MVSLTGACLHYIVNSHAMNACMSLGNTVGWGDKDVVELPLNCNQGKQTSIHMHAGSHLYPLLLFPRMLRAAGHGGRYHFQPADHSVLHPPRALWPAEVVPLLRTAQQEGPGQRLDRRREWPMALDPGKTLAQTLGPPNVTLQHESTKHNPVKHNPKRASFKAGK